MTDLEGLIVATKGRVFEITGVTAEKNRHMAENLNEASKNRHVI